MLFSESGVADEMSCRLLVTAIFISIDLNLQNSHSISCLLLERHKTEAVKSILLLT
jgi:hypothetical protein